MECTAHYKNDRKDRIDFIKNVIGMGKVADAFLVDKGHKNGAEIHTVTTNGIIIIWNYHTHKLITLLVARPQQIKRYYIQYNKPIPMDIVNIAYEHYLKGWHNI